MPKNHLKAQNAPKTWPIKRKNVKFTTKPNPGAHPKALSMPINLVFKNLIRLASTNKEVKKILHDQEILVDGKRRKDYRYPVGLMDVLSIPKVNKHYRILINSLNKLYAQEIDKKEASIKISKLTGKTIIKGGIVQLKTLDGRTIKVKKDEYQTSDSLLITIPEQEIKSTLKLEAGSTIILYKGKYVGKIGTVIEAKNGVLRFKDSKEEHETKKGYAIVLGKTKSEIKIQ